jgi:hypothetical protein
MAALQIVHILQQQLNPTQTWPGTCVPAHYFPAKLDAKGRTRFIYPMFGSLASPMVLGFGIQLGSRQLDKACKRTRFIYAANRNGGRSISLQIFKQSRRADWRINSAG